MTGQVSPFAPHIARVLAHKHALGIAYHRERRFFAEFERATVGWPDGVLSETVVRTYLSRHADGGRPATMPSCRPISARPRPTSFATETASGCSKGIAGAGKTTTLARCATRRIAMGTP